ncbi:DUF1326 domain-containing protein [Natronococcus sp. A-GB1]|uniref:DUF1326 domain-containing protein n=1 Tax=Natronococcus sp. A-GB1 TaxID=3037648 RepID=UPI00241E9028|nr:DUF1326 domain-containing protein [Natronococcus sp. A-GB1]MDG5761708.1 DUF1326 domain-containing protein [Natronococcus sp. A-GB1]
MTASTQDSPEWRLAGEFIEACNCSVPCQCLWYEPPDDDRCTFAGFWTIEEGTYDDVSLDGLGAGMLVWEDGVLLEGGWHVVLVIDEAADDDQAEALEAIFSGEAGGLFEAAAPLIETVEDSVAVPFSYSTADGHRSFSAGDIVTIETDDSAGFGDRQGTVFPHPFLPPDERANTGRTTDATVDYDDDFSWDVGGNNSYFGPFEMASG